MTELSSADFMKLTINEISDMLLSDITESEENVKGALLYGKDNEGNPYRLSVVLELICDE